MMLSLTPNIIYDLYDKKPFAMRSFGHRVEEDLSAVLSWS